MLCVSHHVRRCRVCCSLDVAVQSWCLDVAVCWFWQVEHAVQPPECTVHTQEAGRALGLVP